MESPIPGLGWSKGEDLDLLEKGTDETSPNKGLNDDPSPPRNIFSIIGGLGKIRAAPVQNVATETTPLSETPAATSQSNIFSRMLRPLIKDKAALVGAAIIALFLVWSLVEGILQVIDGLTRRTDYAIKILGGNPLVLDFSHSLLPPSTKSIADLMGTDYYGHSIWFSILYAAPRDALAGIVVVAVGILIGMLLGTSAALFGGWVETVFMRLTDAFLAVPALVLAIVVGILVGTGFESVLIALIVVWWPTYARFFRGQALALKRRGFIGAARLCGTGSLPDNVQAHRAQFSGSHHRICCPGLWKRDPLVFCTGFPGDRGAASYTRMGGDDLEWSVLLAR